MQRTQIFFRLLMLTLSLCWLSFTAYTQAPITPARNRVAPPAGLVYVSQHIDLRQQLSADETVYSLDGEPIPQLQTTSVTLGLLLDAEGHVATRLANTPSLNAPLQLTIYPAGGQGGQFRANLIGLDSVTGFCLLKIENLPPNYTNFATSKPPMPSALPRTVQLWGFNPKQRGSGTPGVLLIKPRLFNSTGTIKKATDDFRYSTSNPIYYLVAPTLLTPVQDCSVAVEKDGSIMGLVAYDTSGEDIHLVYPLPRIQQLSSMITAHKRIVVPHAWLGAMSGAHDPRAMVTTVPKKLTEAERGVLITQVFPDSPAELAGIRPNDMLISVSGRTLVTGADLSSALRLLPADSNVTLKVRRGNELKTFPARLAPAPATDAKQQINWMMSQMEDYEQRARQLPVNDPERAKNESKRNVYYTILSGITNAAPPETWLRLMYGVEVTALTPQLAKHLAAPGGAIIAMLNPSGKLALAGAKAGDVIVKIGEQVIADSTSLMQALSNEKADPLEILVVRQGQVLNLHIVK